MPQKKYDNSNYSISLFAYWHDPRWNQFVGATVKIWDLALNLAKLGHEVTLFLPKYHFNQRGIPFRLIEVPLLNFPLLRSLSFSINLIFILLFSFITHPISVVYVRRGISIIPLLFSIFKKALLIYEINDDPYSYPTKNKTIFSNIRNWLSLKTDEIYLRVCDIGSIINEGLKKKVCYNNPNVFSDKLIVIPSNSNLSLFKPLEKSRCQFNLELSSEKKYIGFIGSLLEHQGIDILIDSAPGILKKHASTFFLILGEGPMKEAWVKKVESKYLKKSFRFFGQIRYEELPQYIGAMDICVAPFLKSAGLRSPVKIFDYLASGRPVISSNIPGTTDIFVESGAVKLVPPEDPRVLARAISDLLEDMETAEDMGQKGRRFMENNFDRRFIAEKIIRELEKVISERTSQ